MSGSNSAIDSNENQRCWCSRYVRMTGHSPFTSNAIFSNEPTQYN